MAEEISEEQRKQMEEKLKNMSPEEIAELQKQQCIFCQIISGQIPSKKVYEDNVCIVVLDINPASSGHCLILPNQHYAIMPQVPETELNHMFKVSKAMSQILLKSMRAKGTNIFVANGAAAGQKAPHFMIHLIPRKDDDGLFNYETKIIESEIREKIGQAVKMKFNQLMGIKVETQTELPEHQEEVSGDEPDKIEKLDDLAGPSENQEDVDNKESDDNDDDSDSEDEDSEGSDQEENDSKDVGDDEPEPLKDDVDASLDDIANLFK
ncbi:HIT domain-containing protein [archaeon]|jgi:histidine triad (HIT) family protein|nr:HIT domain-containing protein [archaeon]MBT3450447.1 HIT domain-containing protein [archaeon]MBT6868996.1 HIT domain-containing protein [archaeon]MBT7193262.1 HIT domain-containing protein [archaeon]MBT7380117.1 HIT domain-containing protein [archaeon]